VRCCGFHLLVCSERSSVTATLLACVPLHARLCWRQPVQVVCHRQASPRKAVWQCGLCQRHAPRVPCLHMAKVLKA
jgi:hypothetical protein